MRVVVLGSTVLALAAIVAPFADAQSVTYTIETVAGSSDAGDGQIATRAQISDAQGVAIDRAGNLYIADPDSNRVRVVRPSGIIETLAGAGSPGFGGDGGPAKQALLQAPYGVAVDAAGNVYIADLGNRRVRKVTPDGRISTVAGNGQKGSSGDGGPATAATLTSPRNVAPDFAGNLYIADFEANTIRKLNPSGTITTLVSDLKGPAGMAVDASGTLYVAETAGARIRKIQSGALTELGAGQFNVPTGVAVDATGALWIADSGNRRVVVYSPSSGSMRVAASPLESARDIAIDTSGAAWIADGRRVRKLNQAGAMSVVAGDGTFGFGGDGGPATASVLNQPSGLALAADGALYISDSRNHRIRKLTTSGVISTFLGTGAASSGADGTPASSAAVWNPGGASMDASQMLWIAETGANQLRRVLANGSIYTVLQGLKSPSQVVADGQGNLYVVETAAHRVRKLLPSGAQTTVAGTGLPGFTGDGGQGTEAQLNSPHGVALDSAGVVYIADTGNHRVRRVSLDGKITTVAGVEPALNVPHGVAVAPDGRLFIADSGNHRILEVSLDGATRVIAGTAIAGIAGDGGPAAEAQLNFPSALAVDAAGNVYLADQLNHRVRKLTPRAPVVAPPPVVTPPPPPPPPPPPASNALRVANAASLQAGPVAPGELISIFGSGLGPVAGTTFRPDQTGVLVLFDGVPGTMSYVQETQINLQVPSSVEGKRTVAIEVRYQGERKALTTIDVAASAPGLFASAGNALALNEDRSLNGPSNAAAPRSILTFFATGEGATKLVDSFTRPVLSVKLTVGGQDAEILYAGAAPGFAGLMQINARLPQTGALGGAFAVKLIVGGNPSQDGVTITVKGAATSCPLCSVYN